MSIKAVTATINMGILPNSIPVAQAHNIDGSARSTMVVITKDVPGRTNNRTMEITRHGSTERR